MRTTAADAAPWLMPAALRPGPAPQPASAGQAAGGGAGRTSPGLRRLELGQVLRALREDRGLRLEDVAFTLGVAPSTLSRIETGKAPTRTSYLKLLLDQYGINDPDYQRQLTDLAREGQRSSWWTDHKNLLPPGFGRYLDLEATASAVDIYAAQTIPGLLQTADYAHALTRLTRPDLKPGQVNDLVTLQLRRQEELRRNDAAVSVVLDEAALLRVIGSVQVMTTQYEHLIAGASTINLQVTALGKPCSALSQSFTILRFARRADADVACYTGTAAQAVFNRGSVGAQVAGKTMEALSRSAISPAASANLITSLVHRVG
jgi:transcriptional regulator with XRE-family HTH domain